MNESQYRRICIVCDYILNAKDSTIERVAIPWLHIIREHPVFLKNYTDLLYSKRNYLLFRNYCFRIARNIVSFVRIAVRCISRLNGKFWIEGNIRPETVDVLFVSHLVNESHAGQSDDFYFGALPDKFAGQGRSSLIALVNYTQQKGEVLVKRWDGCNVPRIIFTPVLGFKNEAIHFWRLFKESVSLGEFVKRESDPFIIRVLRRASHEAFSSGAMSSLRVGSQVAQLVSALKPKAVIVTYEGHAWERIVFESVRQVCPNVKCIGYQHAALFRLQHAAGRLLQKSYNPDSIMTAGRVSEKQLKSRLSLSGIPIFAIGSNRCLKSQARRQRCRLDEGQDETEDELHQVCLVLPEGIADECYLLFDFSLACAKALPHVTFLWRLHPLMSFEFLAVNNEKLRDLPPNIIRSKATIEADIVSSHWALYRGTTAILPAVVAGLRPIYYELKGEMTVDPLFELEVFRKKVGCISEFERVISSDIRQRFCFDQAELETARSYCEDFFLPLKPEVLGDFIDR
ncbi:hypothetical protein EKD00_08515 [Chlorobium phaeovibrioides]|uniref:hypothetical protein n=1 Tax=Chlorobium phaeovibrioides TaxID=1094 RepID=UPI000F83C240|nr:hypothetical protein [Chlorobium phaeovibrioides]RTY34209.1 hypothetical protein EKD00_08515 [Chlorobium phaeovibrioides]